MWASRRGRAWGRALWGCWQGRRLSLQGWGESEEKPCSLVTSCLCSYGENRLVTAQKVLRGAWQWQRAPPTPAPWGSGGCVAPFWVPGGYRLQGGCFAPALVAEGRWAGSAFACRPGRRFARGRCGQGIPQGLYLTASSRRARARLSTLAPQLISANQLAWRS